MYDNFGLSFTTRTGGYGGEGRRWFVMVIDGCNVVVCVNDCWPGGRGVEGLVVAAGGEE